MDRTWTLIAISLVAAAHSVGYDGRAPDADWRKTAARRIEQHRKAELEVRVVDAAGSPVRDAEVHMRMTRHAFGFGSAIAAKCLVEDSPNGRRYRDVVEKYYNKVVFENDLKWGPWKAAASNRNQTFRGGWTDAALKWLADRDIAVRGHWLSWGSVSSGGQEAYIGKPVELQRDLFAHIREKTKTIGSRVCEWDAINHPVGWGVTYEKMFKGIDFHVDVFRFCRETAPGDVTMWINEGQILPDGRRRDAYERIIRYLGEHGQKPDGIGFMGHFRKASLTGMDELYDVFDRYAALVPALQITEFDVDAGRDEALHADYLRDFMTLAFSHPNIEGIIMWGFWEGRHWKPAAALYRKDWSIKPVGQAWIDLVHGAWRTDVTGRTNADGQYATRGFLGDYSVTVSSARGTGAAEAVLPAGGGEILIRLHALPVESSPR